MPPSLAVAATLPAEERLAHLAYHDPLTGLPNRAQLADRRSWPWRARRLRIGASIGAALYPGDAADAESLHRHADSAMYRAKETGSGFAAYRPGPTDPLARLSLAAALCRGLGENALSLDYQPVFRTPTREMMGVEALVCWDDPVSGRIPPRFRPSNS